MIREARYYWRPRQVYVAAALTFCIGLGFGVVLGLVLCVSR